MRILTSLILAAASLTASAQASKTDPLAPLDFLLGTWAANANAPDGSAAAAVYGTYTFSRDLGGHAMQRTGTVAPAKARKTSTATITTSSPSFQTPRAGRPSRLALRALPR